MPTEESSQAVEVSPEVGLSTDEEPPLEGLGQGLYVTLPAEELTLAGFAQGGADDTMAPGPLLATVMHAITGDDGSGLAKLSDDQLVGVLSGARRLEARACWTRLAALAEFARRRPPTGEPVDTGLAGFSDFAADELTGELRATSASVAEQLGYACTVAERLPETFAALSAGLIHPVHLKIIEDETRILSEEDVARADGKLAEAAKSKTFGQLRYAAHRLVLELDSEAALKRKETAKRDAHVRRFREDSGNAGMVGRELPPDEVLASWQHVEQRALDLRAAGVEGTLQELRVRAYLDLLQERDCRDHSAPGGRADGASASEEPEGNEDPRGGTDDPSDPGSSDGDPGPQDNGPDFGGNGGPGHQGGGPATSGGPGGRGGRARQAREDKGPSIAALVNITAPWSALHGDTGPPGEAAGFGLLDHQATRELAAAAARHPDTRWCLTILNPDGTAAAHACAPGRYRAPPDLAELTARLVPIARGHCDHRHAETGYRPSRKLQHLINVRNTRCTASGCGRPAARCDKDHTIPWDQGGPTCECDLAPLCRHHHRCKQAQGWHLEQPEPGVLVWHTPSGRSYVTTPSRYPI